MPNHKPDHQQRMTAESAAARRTAKVAGLLVTAPPLKAAQVASLQRLLAAAERLDDEADR